MRRLKLVILALTLSVVTLAAAALPAAAAPGDNQPAAWVNFTGTASGGGSDGGGSTPGKNPQNVLPNVLPNVQINVKRLAGGATVGHMTLRSLKFMKLGAEVPYELVDSHFERPGIANILAICPARSYWWWRIEDNGEPGGANDAFVAYIYMGTETPSWPPNPAEAWFPMIPYGTIAPDNIQVHITTDY